MIRRLRCLLTNHAGKGGRRGIDVRRTEWRFRYKVLFADICSLCGGQIYEGDSGGWIIPAGFHLEPFLSAPNPYRNLRIRQDD